MLDTALIRTALTDARDRLAGMTGVPNPLPTINAALAALDAAPVSPVFLAVYIGTTNDTNGNPRRGWYVSRLDGAPVIASVPTGRKGETAPAYTCWVEEGYSGDSALYGAVSRVSGIHTGSSVGRDRAAARGLVHETGRINATPGEYRDARKLPRLGNAARLAYTPDPE